MIYPIAKNNTPANTAALQYVEWRKRNHMVRDFGYHKLRKITVIPVIFMLILMYGLFTYTWIITKSQNHNNHKNHSQLQSGLLFRGICAVSFFLSE